MLTNFSASDVKTIKESVSKQGSKVKYLIVSGATAEGGSSCMCARASEKMSEAMWAKQLGVPKLREVGLTSSADMKQAVLECRAKPHFEKFGAAYTRTRQPVGKPMAKASKPKYADASTQTEPVVITKRPEESKYLNPPIPSPTSAAQIRKEMNEELEWIHEIDMSKARLVLAIPRPPPPREGCSEWEEDEIWRWEIERLKAQCVIDTPCPRYK